MNPVYVHEDVGSQSSRRLIVISYFFPPDTAVGARRWEKFCHHAAERGWGIDVLMHAGADMAPTRRLRELPTGVRVYGVEMPEFALPKLESAVADFVRARRRRADPGSSDSQEPSATQAPAGSIARSDLRWALHTPRGWLRLYWTCLDLAHGRAWSRSAIRAGIAVFEPGIHRAVISSSPPYMAQEAARVIGTECGIPSVLDMRDPWRHVERLIESVATPLSLHFATRYESRAVAQAALVVANTEVSRRQLAATYPSRADDIITVTNGADEDPLPPQRAGGRFVVAHAGTLYLDRDPRGLFSAAAAVIRDLALTPADFGLAFIGDLEAVGGFPIHEVARQEGISEYVQTGPPLPHAEALAFMSQGTMLLTMSGSNMAAVPAKTFECIRFPAWVLALSMPGSATELLLSGTNADVVAPSDGEAIAAVIRARYAQHRAGVIPAPVGAEPRFSRRYQADILFDALECRLGADGKASRDVLQAVAPMQQDGGDRHRRSLRAVR